MTTSLLAALLAIATTDDRQPKILDGVTFFDQPGVLYVRLRQIAQSFGKVVEPRAGKWQFGGQEIRADESRKLLDGTLLVRVGSLSQFRMTAQWDPTQKMAVVKSVDKPGKALFVRRGNQRVVVNKSHLMLVGWQGESVVFRSGVGIGRRGYETPNGTFQVQAYRAKMHRSSLYNNTPMPWSVQIVGNVFIHGSPQASGRSSHGCIRLPQTGANPAKWFFTWIEKGTPVSIQGNWPHGAKA